MKPIKLKVKTNLDHYPIIIGSNLIRNLNSYLNKNSIIFNQCLLVIDKKVPKRLINNITKALKRKKVFKFNFDASEKNKNIKYVNEILKILLNKNFSRQDCLITIGGGITGDVGGFASSLFKRGLNFVNIPTTLLSQVDSSIGGKTGVNTKEGKNLIGSFYQPKMVISDIEFLKSLPKREIICGYGEIFKHSLILNKQFFKYLNINFSKVLNLKSPFIEKAIYESCKIKKTIVEKDEKEKNLRKILNKFKNKNYYDCLLPISGGKDSTFQTYVLTKIYNVTPIAVTHGTNWMSLNGRYNLENCINTFDLDHLFFLPNRNIVNRVAKKSAEFIGDACWHCHIGTQTFPIQTAIKWQIPLMIYGESIAERDGRGSYKKLLDHNKKYFYGLKVSAKVRSEKFIGDGIEYSELKKWNYPKKKEMENSKLVYLHLGDYIFWDEQKQTEFIINNFNWKMNNRVENTYKGFKSNECIMAGVHDYFNFIKRGVGRATLHASDDVRRGLIKRIEAKNLIKKYDPERPHALDYYLKITGYKENEIEKKIIDSRKLSKFASKLNKI